MTVYSLLPSRKKRSLAVRDNTLGSPFCGLGRRPTPWDDLFEDFWAGSFGELSRSESFVPDCNVTEDEKSYTVSAELPGLDEKDIDISLSEGVLTIKGEKKAGQDRNKNGCRHIERSYGRFERTISLAEEVDQEKASAEFDKGVLTIQLPKLEPRKQKVHKIDIANN